MSHAIVAVTSTVCATGLVSICHNSPYMCGRYRLSRRKQLVEEYFDVSSDTDDWNPRFNIAPTQPVPVVRQHPKESRRDLSLMRWGLIPSWAKDTSGGEDD
jgi:putative SOS response-associated peptidase YedK